MARWGWWLAGALAFSVYSCDDQPTKPLAGAGLRLYFPEGSQVAQGIRITLLDPDNAYILPDCQNLSRSFRSPIVPQTLVGDCDSLHVQVRDLIGTPVREMFCVASPDSACDLYWDGRDQEGNVVPDGYYYYHLRCVNSDSLFDAERPMYILSQSECDWPLWSRTLESIPPDHKVEMSPFPVNVDLSLMDAGSGDIDAVHFVNPFRIRVEVPNMQVFEHNVTLIEGEYTEVTVTLEQLTRRP